MRIIDYKGTNSRKLHIRRVAGLKPGTWLSIGIIVTFITPFAMIGYSQQQNNKQVQLLSNSLKAYASEPAAPKEYESMTIEERVTWEAFISAAHKLAPIYDYPVKVIIAQGALESARGTSRYARERYNYFGIGAFDHNPDLAYTYENMEQGIIEYMRFVKVRFPEAYASRSNPDKMVELLKKNKSGKMYATDPGYINKLKALPEWRKY